MYPVRYVPSTYCFDYSCTAFLLFLKVHTKYILILGEYVLWVPDSQRFRHLPTHWTKPHSVKHLQFYSLLLGSTLVSSWAPGLGAGAATSKSGNAAGMTLYWVCTEYVLSTYSCVQACTWYVLVPEYVLSTYSFVHVTVCTGYVLVPWA